MRDFKKYPILFFLVVFILCSNTGFGQEQDEEFISFKNQVSTNLVLPLFESFDFNYERTIANKWAIGLAGAIYGESARDLFLASSYEVKTNWEIMPFGRIYFQGAQNKSHFVELFGSVSETEETGRLIRTTNDSGFGVYDLGTRTYTVGGVGAGYGYRFLLLNRRLVLEAQVGIRTNFDFSYFVLNGAFVRTGIKVGYRF